MGITVGNCFKPCKVVQVGVLKVQRVDKDGSHVPLSPLTKPRCTALWPYPGLLRREITGTVSIWTPPPRARLYTMIEYILTIFYKQISSFLFFHLPTGGGRSQASHSSPSVAEPRQRTPGGPIHMPRRGALFRAPGYRK